MSCFENKTTFLEKIDFTIDEMYVYIHRKNISESNLINQIFLLLIFTIFIMILTKLSIIFICFILKWTFCDLPLITYKIWSNKCSNLCKEIFNNIIYLKKVCKKIFTYNFYSFDSSIYGNIIIFVIPVIYILFIIMNFIYAIDIRNFKKSCFYTQFIHISVFYLHLLVELYSVSFYAIKDLILHLKFTFFIFTIANLNILWLFLLLSNINYNETICFFAQRIARLILCFFFIGMYYFSIKRIINYKINSKK